MPRCTKGTSATSASGVLSSDLLDVKTSPVAALRMADQSRNFPVSQRWEEVQRAPSNISVDIFTTLVVQVGAIPKITCEQQTITT